jgi:hypothetical protein
MRPAAMLRARIFVFPIFGTLTDANGTLRGMNLMISSAGEVRMSCCLEKMPM